eukprot:182867-Prorocentrum_minimum.AAC.1
MAQSGVIVSGYESDIGTSRFSFGQVVAGNILLQGLALRGFDDKHTTDDLLNNEGVHHGYLPGDVGRGRAHITHSPSSVQDVTVRFASLTLLPPHKTLNSKFWPTAPPPSGNSFSAALCTGGAASHKRHKRLLCAFLSSAVYHPTSCEIGDVIGSQRSAS